jgi:methyl-accepting chemotaxis protein
MMGENDDNTPKEANSTLGFGASGSPMTFGQVLTLVQSIRTEIRDSEKGLRADIKEIKDLSEVIRTEDRTRAKELHDKIDDKVKDLHERIDAIVKELRDKINDESKGINDKTDDLTERVKGLESDKESLMIQIRDIKNSLDEIDTAGNIKERFDKIDAFHEKAGDVGKRLDNLEDANKEKDEFGDIPFFLRPSYIKAMGLAVAAVITAVAIAYYTFKDGPSPEKDATPTIEVSPTIEIIKGEPKDSE